MIKSFVIIIILLFFLLFASLTSCSFVIHLRDEIEDEQYLFEGVKLTEAEHKELR